MDDYVEFVEVTTRNEVDEDAWDSDGTHTHTSAVTGSTTQTMRMSHGQVVEPETEASRSSWLDQMQRNEPQPYTATLKQQMKGAGEPGADALQRFAQFAEALDDGLCRLAAVAIAQNAINNVKAALYNSAATAIQAAERGRQARKRFRVALGRSRDARLKRLLATAVKLGVLTLLLCILLALWLREGGSQQCVAPAPTCRPRPPPAPAPAPARAPSTAFRVAAPGGAASAAQACRPRP